MHRSFAHLSHFTIKDVYFHNSIMSRSLEKIKNGQTFVKTFVNTPFKHLICVRVSRHIAIIFILMDMSNYGSKCQRYLGLKKSLVTKWNMLDIVNEMNDIH